MLSVQFNQVGSWHDVLEQSNIDLSSPAANQVQVKILARPINPSDEMFIQGIYRWKPELPQIAGLEGAGMVVACGPGTDQSLMGKKVCFRTPGTWAEFINIDVDKMHILPDSLSDSVACQLSLNVFTAFALLDETKVKANDWLVITAAHAVVGKLVIQLAARKGINVIAIVRKEEHREVLQRLGAKAVLNSEKVDLTKEIMALTGNGISAGIDAVGGNLATQLIRSSKPLAKLIVYGRLGHEPATYFNADVIYRNMSIMGFGIDQWIASHDASYRDSIWNEMIALVTRNQLVVPVEREYSLRDFRSAITDYQRTKAKVILR